MGTQDDEIERDKLIFDLIKGRFDGEIKRTNDLDSKAHNSVGYVSVIVGLLLGSGSLLSGAEIFKNKLPIFFLSQPVLAAIYFGGIAILLLSIGFALSALKVRKWIVVPNVKILIENYTNCPYEEVLKRNAGEMANAVLLSEEQNNNKAKLIEASWYLLVIGLSMIFLATILLYIQIPKLELESFGVWIPLAAGLIIGLIYAIISGMRKLKNSRSHIH